MKISPEMHHSHQAPKFFNRELSWLEFNTRVLDEACQKNLPLLDRLKFLCIVSSNFDEFFMVRVGSLLLQKASGKTTPCPSGLSCDQQLAQISTRAHQIIDKQYEVFRKEVRPGLSKNGIHLVDLQDLTKEDVRELVDVFHRELFPAMTPIKVEDNKEFPLFGNQLLHVIFHLQSELNAEEKVLGIVPVSPKLPRLIALPSKSGELRYTFLEEVIRLCGTILFPGYKTLEHTAFRVIRNADMSVDEERDEDFVKAMQEALGLRITSAPVRLSVQKGSPLLSGELLRRLNVDVREFYEVDGTLELKGLMDLCFVQGFDHLRLPQWPARPIQALEEAESMWELLSRKEILLHHPYQSFMPVVRMVQEAASDPNTLAIKCTLYRTSGKSPIVQALIRAAQKGIQVTALVELKARFDEEQNIQWANALENAGAIVVYGLANLKVHAKAMMIVRREESGIRRYVHLGTGNYNEKTAALYTDMGILSSRQELGDEVSLFFNAITGYSSVLPLDLLSMAPLTLKRRVIQLIEREIERSTPQSPGLIIAKMNALAHPEVIEALYRASRAGVKIQLNVRGICQLVPGDEVHSENIRVVSVIDRFLEHTRAFYFHNGGAEEVFLSSADWMPRNLDRRVELLFPVLDPAARKQVIQSLKAYFKDNQHSHELQKDGTWRRLEREGHAKSFSVQAHFYESLGKRSEDETEAAPVFKVRRTAPKI